MRASESAVERIFFGLKDVLPRQEWKHILEALELSADEVDIF